MTDPKPRKLAELEATIRAQDEAHEARRRELGRWYWTSTSIRQPRRSRARSSS